MSSQIIKRYDPWPFRRNWGIKAQAFFLVCLVCFITASFKLSVSNHDGERTRHKCPSEVNRRSDTLAEKNVHVLSSTLPVLVFDDTFEKQHTVKREEVECVTMLLPDHSNHFKICIYDSSKDLVVSKYIKTYKAWEKEYVAEMLKAFRMFPEIMLVDLGSNLGIFTLPAARAGTEVIAVDALKENHQLLQMSLTENNLSCLVTLVHNAIHGKRGQMKITLNPQNVGGSFVMDIPDFHMNKILTSEKVDAVCLDDLVPMVKGRSVFLKMDIEGSEEAALECADQFFQQVTVKVLLIEWMFYRHNEKGSANIKNFMESHGMVATWGVDRSRVIDLDASNSWPDNVFWMQK